MSGLWSYEEAFCRNQGLITQEEQQKLRRSRVAIAGLGGVGGVHLVTLARLGIGCFTIADPDTFEPANFNRQYGATTSTLGRSKVEVMAEVTRQINPEVDLKIFSEPIGSDNAAAFLQGANLLVDGIDAFEVEARRILYRQARAQGIWVVNAGPLGFSTGWLLFDPKGMSFDRYFDLSDGMDPVEKVVAFLVGVCPAMLPKAYTDLSYVNIPAHMGPSSSLACQLAAGVAAAEALKILLKRGKVFPAPFYYQFDPYLGRFVRGKLRGGNRHPVQRLKRWWLEGQLQRR